MGLTRIRAEQISDIDYKQAVRAISVSNVTLASGAPATVDGVSLVVADRILVNGQSLGAQNGIYEVQTVGTGSTGTWIRSSDTNATGELQAGTIVMVTEGVLYKDTQWKLTTNNPIVIGTTVLTFEQTSAYAFGNVTANGTSILATTVGDVLTFTAGNNISITGNSSAKSVTIGVVQNPTFTGNVTGGNLITAGQASVTGNITGGNLNTAGNANIGNLNLTGNIVDTGALVLTTGASGNITLAPNGTNVVIATTTGANVTGTLNATGNITGGNLNTAGDVRATAGVYGLELYSTQRAGDEGGQLNLANPLANSTIAGVSVTVDIWQNRFRIFEQGGNARGAFIDITACGPGVSTNLLAGGGGGGTPGGANTQVQFNDNGSFGGNAAFTFNKTTSAVVATGNITGGNVFANTFSFSQKTFSANLTLNETAYNAYSVGPITVANAAVITVANSSTWVVI